MSSKEMSNFDNIYSLIQLINENSKVFDIKQIDDIVSSMQKITLTVDSNAKDTNLVPFDDMIKVQKFLKGYRDFVKKLNGINIDTSIKLDQIKLIEELKKEKNELLASMEQKNKKEEENLKFLYANIEKLEKKEKEHINIIKGQKIVLHDNYNTIRILEANSGNDKSSSSRSKSVFNKPMKKTSSLSNIFHNTFKLPLKNIKNVNENNNY